MYPKSFTPERIKLDFVYRLKYVFLFGFFVVSIFLFGYILRPTVDEESGLLERIFFNQTLFSGQSYVPEGNIYTPATYSCLSGGDHNGADWSPATDCINGEIAGVHTDIGTLDISLGQTVKVKNYDSVTGFYGTTSIQATTVNIQGTLTAESSGYAGGSPSNPIGGGPGGGIGSCVDGNSNNGTPGGSFGGKGQNGGSYLYPSSNGYGTAFAPTEMGSGGAAGGTGSPAFDCGGGAGGGSIRINANSISITGSILANGQGGQKYASGGGAGGTIAITTQSISGNGSISANGGAGTAYGGGAGSGGRVIIKYSSSNTYSGTLSSTSSGGESGSNLIWDTTNNDLSLNQSQVWYADPAKEGSTQNFRDIVLQNNSTFKLVSYYTNGTDGVGFNFNVRNFNIASGSTITTDGTGYRGGLSNTSTQSEYDGLGPGGGSGTVNLFGDCGGIYRGAGGTYGGKGYGNTKYTYGDFLDPVGLGSGGGSSRQFNECDKGGAGGGAVRINATVSLTVNGTISSKGVSGETNSGAGGSGGSISLIAPTISGNGALEANGGGGQNASGNGGGGRISLKYSSANNYSGTLVASAGSGGTGGEAGTVTILNSSTNDLIIRNTQTWSANPAAEGSSHSFRNVSITNNSTLYLDGYYTSNSNGVGFQFTTTNFTIDSGSNVIADSKGYAGGTSDSSTNGGGPGGGTGATACTGVAFNPGGGSYGGTGGNSSGGTYGSLAAPLDLGSGGGRSYTYGACANGGNGGGAVQIIATEELNVNGTISANGGAGSPDSGGGGSGGSIYLIAGTLNSSVSAALNANGGNATYGGGNGGGGRIAIYFVSANNWAGQELTPTVSAKAGTGSVGGTNGTVFIGQATIPGVSSLRQFRSDCATSIAVGATTSQTSICLGATINSSDNPDNLTVQFEIQPIGSPFTNNPTAQSDPIPFTGTPIATTLVIPNSVVIGTNYHWQIRVVNQSALASDWTQYGGNLESETDFGGGYPSASFQNASSSGAESILAPALYVELNDSSASQIQVNYSVTGGTATSGIDFTLSDGTLTFPANTLTQAIPLTIIEDSVAENNETIEITLSSPTNAVLGTHTVFTYTVTNNDNAGFTSNYVTDNFIYENSGSIDYRIKLNTQPTNDVTVNFTPNAGLNLNKNSITFTSSNWDTYQFYAVSAVDNSVADGNRFVNVSYSVESVDTFYNNYSLSNTSFQIIDNDSIGITLTGASGLSLAEGQTNYFEVNLTSQPTNNVVINFSTSNPKLSMITTSLTFTNGNWNTKQSAYFTVANNFTHEANSSANIISAVTSSDSNYNNYSIANIPVTLVDNDPIGINRNTAASTFVEGNSLTYTLTLTSQPTNNVTITPNANSHVDITPSQITFTPIDWNSNKSFSIEVARDFQVTGNRNYAVTHSVTSSDSDYNNFSLSNLALTITDIDSPNILITQSSGNTAVSESGTTDTYEVVLATEPTNDVEITLNINNSNCAINFTSLTFTNLNWNTHQIITVSKAHDFIDTGNLSCTISHSSTSADEDYNSMLISSVNVTVNNIDTAGFTITEIGSNSTFVAEAGGSDTISIVLNSKPLQNVTLNLADNAQLLYNPTSLIFTNTNWNTPQQVSVSAVNDLIAQGNRTTQLQVLPTSSDAKYAVLSLQSVNVSITDNDTAGFEISDQSFNLNQKSDTENFTIRLTSKPVDDVAITLQPSANNLINFNNSTLTFTELNWNQTQTITVGVDNSLTNYTGTVNINFQVSSTDLVYNNKIIAPSSVALSIIPVIQGDLVFNGSDIQMQGLESTTYQIKLSKQPSSNVTVNLTPPIGELTISPSVLTFTSTNWNSYQTITLTCIVNYYLNEDIIHQITSTDPAFSGLQNKLVNVHATPSAPPATPTPIATNNPSTTPASTTPTAKPSSTVSPTSQVTAAPNQPNIYSLQLEANDNGQALSNLIIRIEELDLEVQTDDSGKVTLNYVKEGDYTISYEFENIVYKKVISLNENTIAKIDLISSEQNNINEEESLRNQQNILTQAGILGIAAGSLTILALLITFLPYIQYLLFSAFALEFLRSLFAIYNSNYSEILELNSNNILKYAQITISSNGQIFARRVTNWQGRYKIKLDAGTYWIKVEKPGYVSETYEITVEKSEYLTVKFEIEKQVENAIASDIQLKVWQIEPRILIYIVGLLASILNLIAVRTPISWTIFGITVASAVLVFGKGRFEFIRKLLLRR